MRWRYAALLALGACGMHTDVGDPHVSGMAKPVETLQGEVASARIQDVGHGSLVLERPGKPLKFEVGSSTVVLVDGSAATLRQVHKGDRARVTYDAFKGHVVARRVEISG